MQTHQKYLLEENKQDLKCSGNHSDSEVLFCELNSKENEQCRLLCSKCLVGLDSYDNLIQIDEAIDQVKQKHEAHFDIQQGILDGTMKQLGELSRQVALMKERFTQIFKAITESVQDWWGALSQISIKPLELNLEQELSTLHLDRNSIKQSCFDDNFLQMQFNFQNSILSNFLMLNELTEQNKIQQTLQKVSSEYNKLYFPSFPKAQELINVIDTRFKCIQAIDFNFDNTKLFIGSKDCLSSIELESGYETTHIYWKSDQQISSICASKKQNLLAASFGNFCGLWYLDEQQRWSHYDFLLTETKIQFLGLNQSEEQIIVQTEQKTSILYINNEKKSLQYIQLISSTSDTSILRINSQWTKFLLCFKNYFMIYEQIDKLWVLSGKNLLQHNQSIEDALFIQNDDIIFRCKVDEAITNMIYEQNKILKPMDSNSNIKIKNKRYQFSPRIFNNERLLYIQQVQNKYHFIKQEQENFSSCPQDISIERENMIPKWSKDGEILVICDPKSSKIEIYKLTYH